jgi:nucleoid-associated protein Lsr2
MIERLVDDIDGSEATQSVQFGVDGIAFQIDLNDQHAEELRTKLTPFIDVARRIRNEGGRTRGAGPRRAPSDKDRNSAIRQWALDEGVELPSRGRIAGAVQAAFDAGDVAALYAAVGLEMAQPAESKRSRR